MQQSLAYLFLNTMTCNHLLGFIGWKHAFMCKPIILKHLFTYNILQLLFVALKHVTLRLSKVLKNIFHIISFDYEKIFLVQYANNVLSFFHLKVKTSSRRQEYSEDTVSFIFLFTVLTAVGTLKFIRYLTFRILHSNFQSQTSQAIFFAQVSV